MPKAQTQVSLLKCFHAENLFISILFFSLRFLFYFYFSTPSTSSVSACLTFSDGKVPRRRRDFHWSNKTGEKRGSSRPSRHFDMPSPTWTYANTRTRGPQKLELHHMPRAAKPGVGEMDGAADCQPAAQIHKPHRTRINVKMWGEGATNCR